MEQSENCYVFGDKKLIIGFGLKDLVIVDAGDIILVMDKNKEQEVKHLVNEIKKTNDLDEYL
jgi:mannose-1-phosphate guanylyltransferase